jgi:hypothetical protein
MRTGGRKERSILAVFFWFLPDSGKGREVALIPYLLTLVGLLHRSAWQPLVEPKDPPLFLLTCFRKGKTSTFCFYELRLAAKMTEFRFETWATNSVFDTDWRRTEGVGPFYQLPESEAGQLWPFHCNLSVFARSWI